MSSSAGSGGSGGGGGGAATSDAGWDNSYDANEFAGIDSGGYDPGGYGDQSSGGGEFAGIDSGGYDPGGYGDQSGGQGEFGGFDYETEAYGATDTAFDYETDANVGIDAGYGPGQITSAVYNPKTGQTEIEQTIGIIDTETYQTANLGAYLDSPDVSDAEKIATLNQLQAISNSNLKGTKLSNVKGDDTEQFIIDNLDSALENIKDQTKYSKYTSSIDENAQTFAGEMEDSGIMGVAKSGGILGSMIRGGMDQYKNNKALELLGYTGKVMRDPRDDTDYMTGGGGGEERAAINQLAPQASYAVANQNVIPSMVDQWFANNQAGTGLDPNYLNTYNTAKAQIANTMGMVDTSNQFGYSATPYGGLTAQNLGTNPFNIAWMQQRGLI